MRLVDDRPDYLARFPTLHDLIKVSTEIYIYIYDISVIFHVSDSETKGLVLGVYKDDNNSNQEFTLTQTAKAYDVQVNGKLCDMIEVAGRPPKEG